VVFSANFRLTVPLTDVAPDAGGDHAVLRVSMQFAEKAMRLQPENSAYHVEVGYQHQQMGDYGAALAKFSEARDLDDLNMAPLYGSINCQLYTLQLDEAAEQIEFLTEIASSTGQTGLGYTLLGLHFYALVGKYSDTALL
jgi:tetratricopeptide (TPR) repeat protein